MSKVLLIKFSIFLFSTLPKTEAQAPDNPFPVAMVFFVLLSREWKSDFRQTKFQQICIWHFKRYSKIIIPKQEFLRSFKKIHLLAMIKEKGKSFGQRFVTPPKIILYFSFKKHFRYFIGIFKLKSNIIIFWHTEHIYSNRMEADKNWHRYHSMNRTETGTGKPLYLRILGYAQSSLFMCPIPMSPGISYTIRITPVGWPHSHLP